MSHFWRRRSSSETPLPAEPGEATPSLQFRSRGFSQLLDEHPEGAPWSVLDLGSASQGNLLFFARRGARFAVEELYQTILPCRRGGKIEAECLAGLPQLLRFDADVRFDLILAWDLLNFLWPEALRALTSRLLPYCRSGTLVHALISMEAKIPSHPGRGTIVDEETLQLKDWDRLRALESPRYTHANLARAMVPFKLHKSYLLKHQMHEHLLVLEDGATADEAGAGSRAT